MPRPKKVVVQETTQPQETPVTETVVQETPVIEVVKAKETFEYSVSLEMNDTKVEFETNNLIDSLYEARPDFLKTRVIFKATSSKGQCERLLLLNQAKMMWRSRTGVEIFVTRLIFK